MTNTTAKLLIRSLYEGAGNDHLLFSSTNNTQPRRLEDYPSIGEAACGYCGKLLVQVFFYATLLGTSTLYLMLAATFLTEAVGGGGEGMLPDLGSSHNADEWTRYWTLICALFVLFPVVLVRSLKEIVPLTALGVGCSLLCVLEIVIFAVIIQPVTAEAVDHFDLPMPRHYNISDYGGRVDHKVVEISNFPVAFASIVMAFGGHAVLPSIEKHMTHRQKFDRTYDLASLTLMIVNTLVGTMGYYSFGNMSSSPILCNFPEKANTFLGFITAITKILLVLHVLFTYPVLMSVVITAWEKMLNIPWRSEEEIKETEMYEDAELLPRQTDDRLLQKPRRDSWKTVCLRVLLRTSLVGFTTLVAVFVPLFPDFMVLVGGLCLTMTCFILPVLFSWILYGHKLSSRAKLWGLVIIITAVVAGITSTVLALKAIFRIERSHNY